MTKSAAEVQAIKSDAARIAALRMELREEIERVTLREEMARMNTEGPDEYAATMRTSKLDIFWCVS